MGKFPRFIVKLACAAALTHVAFSAALALMTEQLFGHRIINVRTVGGDDWKSRAELISSFIDAAGKDERPLIGFFGSSFSYGYPFPPSASFSSQTAAEFPDHRVVNVSVLATSLEGIHSSLLLAEHQGVRFETIVVEIPVVNELANLRTTGKNWRRHFSEAADRIAWAHDATYMQWYLQRPYGVRYLAMMFEELTLANGEIPLSLIQPTEGYFVTADEFRAMRGEYVDMVRATLETAQRVCDRVVTFPTPIFLKGDDRIRYDVAALREQIKATEAACRSVPGVTALELDERFLTDEKLFSNLTHLGLHGNREFGDWIAATLRRSAGGETAARSQSEGVRR